MGLSFGLGSALAARLDRSDRHTWVLLGDGEIQEGQVWEAAMATTHLEVSNITAIVDKNRTTARANLLADVGSLSIVDLFFTPHAAPPL